MLARGHYCEVVDRDLGGPNRLDMDSSRLLCDDGYSANGPSGSGKSEASCGVDGLPAAGLDAASSIRQEGGASV